MNSATASVGTAVDITHDIALGALDAAVKAALAIDQRVSISVLDAGGHLLAFIRMHDIHAGTVDVSLAKARCSAMFKRATSMFAEAYANGATSLPALPGVLPFEGGVPVFSNGRLIAAVGASGAAPEQDGAIAQAAADFISASIGACHA